MGQVHTYKIERLRITPDQPHRQQTFFIRPGSRSRPWKFFQGAAVPEFEGPHAFFEIERVGKCWVFLRRVEGR